MDLIRDFRIPLGVGGEPGELVYEEDTASTPLRACYPPHMCTVSVKMSPKDHGMTVPEGSRYGQVIPRSAPGIQSEGRIPSPKPAWENSGAPILELHSTRLTLSHLSHARVHNPVLPSLPPIRVWPTRSSFRSPRRSPSITVGSPIRLTDTLTTSAFRASYFGCKRPIPAYSAPLLEPKDT